MTSTKAYRQNYSKNSREAWANWKAPHLSDFAVAPGFAYNIAKYYPSSRRTSDKDLCVKLMKDLGLSSDPAAWYNTVSQSKKRTYKSRPPSAPPRLQVMESYSQNPKEFYMTSHKKDFTGLRGSPAANARPSTAKLFPNRVNHKETTYQTEFGEKRIKKHEVPGRNGTSSGVRRNNPHPSEAFMIWKFPGNLPPLDPAEYNTLNMEEIAYDQLKSTYQNDYTGIPQGVQIQTAFDGSMQESLPRPPYTLDSTARHSYQKPEVHDALKCNLSRYGCNKNKYKPTIGAVPTVSATSPHMHLLGRTEYNDEYYRKALANIAGEHVRYKSGPIPALEEFLKNANPQEKNALVQELKKIVKDGYRDTKNPDWSSKYTGPS